jgi:hypothetical protein
MQHARLDTIIIAAFIDDIFNRLKHIYLPTFAQKSTYGILSANRKSLKKLW